MDLLKRFFCKKANDVSYEHSSSDSSGTNEYVTKEDIDEQLAAKYGKNDIHLENLKHLQISSLTNLGYGAFSVVKKTYSNLYDSFVAVKVIRLDDEQNASYIEKCLPNELNLWQKLSTERHRNLLNLFEHSKIEPFQYIITEIAERGDLHEFLKIGTMSEFKAKRAFRDIITGIKYCHSKGIAHRDIKPQNLLIGNEDQLKLAG